MTTTADACLARVRAAAGDRLTDDELEGLIEAVQTRASRRTQARGGAGAPAADALLSAAQEIGDEIAAARAIEKRNAAINAIRRAERDKTVADMIAAGADPALAIEAINVGINRPMPGGRLSVDARQKAQFASLVGGLVAELRRGGLLEYASRPEGGAMARILGVGNGPIDREIARELWEIGREGGQPGITGNAEAARIAAILSKYQEIARGRQNRAGAWIGRQEGYIVAQSHDMARIRRAGFEAWKAEILPRLDPERTFGDADPEAFLRGVYAGLTTGEHYRPPVEGNRLMAFKGPANLARKVSQERQLHFRSADDWWGYNASFGSGSLWDAAIGGLRRAADAVALMEVWGTNPRAAFEADLDALRQRHRNDPATVDRLNRGALKHQFAEITGETKIPGNVTVARWGAAVRAIEAMSKLGGAVVSSITDVGTYASEVRYQGRTLLDGYAEAVANIAPGADGAARREIADRIGVGIEAMVGDIAGRITAADAPPGAIAKAQRLFFKLNLMGWWTDAHKTGHGFAFARELGSHAATDHAALPEKLRRMMDQYGIGAAQWDALRRTAWSDAEGRTFLTPDRALDLDDAAVTPLIAAELDGIRNAWGGRVDALVARYGRALDRLEAVARLMGEAEGAEIRATVDGWRRKNVTTERLRTALADARASAADRTEGGQPSMAGWNRIRQGITREFDQVTAQIVRDGQAAAVKADRLRTRAGRLAREDAKGAIDAVRAEIEDVLATLGRMPDQLDGSIADATVRARESLEERLRAMIVDRTDFAVLTPGARERAIMVRSTQAGTAVGEVDRFLMQFKAFPVAFLTKAWGREVYGDGAASLKDALLKGRADWLGIAHLVTATTVLGYVAMAAKDAAKGREPRDPRDPATWAAAMKQGGGLGIYGDFLFGEANRMGGGLVATAAGPAAGSAEQLAQLMWKMRDGDDAAAGAFRFALGHTPGLNLFYVRPLLDYLILHDVAEALNPGSLRRLERRVEKENRQAFLLRPSVDRLRPITGGSP